MKYEEVVVGEKYILSYRDENEKRDSERNSCNFIEDGSIVIVVHKNPITDDDDGWNISLKEDDGLYYSSTQLSPIYPSKNYKTEITTEANPKTKNSAKTQTKQEVVQMNNQNGGFNMNGILGDGFNFDVTKLELSMMGDIAVNVNGKKLSIKKGSIQDVTGFTMPANNMVMIMPAKKVAVGDMIVHNNAVVGVVEIVDGKIIAIDLAASTKIELVKVTNVFGMQFYAKVFSLFGGKSMKKMLPMMMMTGGQTPFGGTTDGGQQNPMTQMMMAQSIMGGESLDFDFENMFNLEDDNE